MVSPFIRISGPPSHPETVRTARSVYIPSLTLLATGHHLLALCLKQAKRGIPEATGRTETAAGPHESL